MISAFSLVSSTTFFNGNSVPISWKKSSILVLCLRYMCLTCSIFFRLLFVLFFSHECWSTDRLLLLWKFAVIWSMVSSSYKTKCYLYSLIDRIESYIVWSDSLWCLWFKSFYGFLLSFSKSNNFSPSSIYMIMFVICVYSEVYSLLLITRLG